jgi:hypothetical protein
LLQQLDHGTLDEINDSLWKLADVYMTDVPLLGLASDHALRLLIRRDFPTLVRELLRLRPDLA